MIRVVVTVLESIVIDRASTMASSMKRAAAKSVSDVDVPQVRPEDTPLVSIDLSLFGRPLNNSALVRCGPPDPCPATRGILFVLIGDEPAMAPQPGSWTGSPVELGR
jgi:hypothetical protein